MNVLVTGGAGYKGTKLVRSLLKRGHKVTIIDNFLFGFEPIIDIVTNKNTLIVKKNISDMSSKLPKDYNVIGGTYYEV